MFEMVKVTIANTKVFCIYANNMMPKVRGIIALAIIPSLPPIATLPRKEIVMIENKTRTYKVSSIYQNDKERPYIKITGKWLEDLGFNIGNTFKVYQGKDILLIVKEN